MQATLERLRQRREERGDEGGFTLIELLIVIVILGILAAIVVFAVQNLTGSSAQSSCKADYKTVETAMEAFNAQMSAYPAAADAGIAAPVYAAPAGFTLPGGDLMGALMTQQGATGPGPWLRDFPGNGNHYQIVITANATAGAPNVESVADASGVPIGATNTSADCGSVK